MKSKLTDLYDFECEVVHHEKEEPTVISYNLYRSKYMEFYKGTKTTKAEFTIVKYSNKFLLFCLCNRRQQKERYERRV